MSFEDFEMRAGADITEAGGLGEEDPNDDAGKGKGKSKK